jgi:hypothetical protein
VADTLNYSHFKNLLGSKPKERLALHTYLLPAEDNSLLIHMGSIININIITYLPTGEIIVRSDKLRNTLTRETINQFIPLFSLIAHEGFWFWVEKGAESKIDNTIAMFTDGDIILSDGTLKFQRGVGDAIEMLDYKAKVREYADLYSKEAPFNLPSSQECWDCFIYKFGTMPLDMSDDHIRSHIDNGIIVPSLLRNALEVTGGSSGGGYGIRSHAFDRASKLGKESREEIAKSVRKYLIKKLGLPTVATLKSQ